MNNRPFDDYYVVFANSAHEDGDYALAITWYTKALEENDGHIWCEHVYIKRANSYFYLREYDSAIQDYKRALLMNPDSVYANTSLKICYEEKVEYPELLNAAKNNNVELVKKLLLAGMKPDKTIYDLAGQDVKNLLNYRPGRKRSTISDYSRDTKNNDLKQDTLKKMFADYDDTSSDDSSDEEITLSPINSFELKPDQEQRRISRIENYNANLNMKPSNIPYEKFAEEYQDLKCVVYRGLHYAPAWYNMDRRHQHQKLKHQNETAVSHATQVKSGLADSLVVNDSDGNLLQAHHDNKTFFANLKIKIDMPEPFNTSRNKWKFDVLYYRFIQAYVENYAQLFSHATISTHYKFDCNLNPALSTTILPQKASYYAAGTRMPITDYLNPHYRRTTLKPKHPCVGVVYAYAMDLGYFFQNGSFILDHIYNNRIGIRHIYRFEYEVLFESLIPGKYQIDKELFVFPSLAEWSNELTSRFGYTKCTFTNDQNTLMSLPSGKNNIDERKKFLGKINSRVGDGFANILQSRVKSKLASESSPKWMVFPFKNKLLTTTPVSPNKKDEWEKATTLAKKL